MPSYAKHASVFPIEHPDCARELTVQFIVIVDILMPGHLYSFIAIENDPCVLTIANERMRLLSLLCKYKNQ
jgi:hypothetical protein